jgi:hypothetical protein
MLVSLTYLNDNSNTVLIPLFFTDHRVWERFSLSFNPCLGFETSCFMMSNGLRYFILSCHMIKQNQSPKHCDFKKIGHWTMSKILDNICDTPQPGTVTLNLNYEYIVFWGNKTQPVLWKLSNRVIKTLIYRHYILSNLRIICVSVKLWWRGHSLLAYTFPKTTKLIWIKLIITGFPDFVHRPVF